MNINLEKVKAKLENSFDVKYREVNTNFGKCTLVFIDDICSAAQISEYVVEPLHSISNSCNSIEEVVTKFLDISAAGIAKDIDDGIDHVLSGDLIICFDKAEKIIYCEVKGFIRRSVSIPVTEAVVKGPREGFTELIVDNVSLIRRKIKNPDLKFETFLVGEKSKTSVCISYLKGMAPNYLINNIKESIKSLNLNFILDTNYIEEKLRGKNSVFDTVGYTEKPDEAAAKILEGRVAVLVDGTPFVITVPYFFLENFQAPDDYYINRYFANFTRVLRWVAFFIATFLPGLYVAIVNYHFALIPSMFLFRLAVARAGVPLPTIIEVLIMVIAFQLIKEAGLRLPQPIGGAMSSGCFNFRRCCCWSRNFFKNNNNCSSSEYFKLFFNTKGLWSFIYMVNNYNPCKFFFWSSRLFLNKSYVSIKTWRFRNRRLFIFISFRKYRNLQI